MRTVPRVDGGISDLSPELNLNLREKRRFFGVRTISCLSLSAHPGIFATAATHLSDLIEY